MAYIAPNSDLHVCKGVPLDNNYKDTIYFSSVANQQSYFSGTVKYSYADLSYQRVDKGKIRIQQCADDLYDCNYMYFRNTAFGSKYFYAFITGVEYINNITSEISYEIDVLQTWHFSYELGYCFVEREHVTDDTIGANVIAEDINYGETKVVDIYASGLLDEYSVVVAFAYDEDETVATGGIYSGILSGLRYEVYDCTLASDVTSFLNFLVTLTEAGKADAIVDIWLMPSDFATTGTTVKTGSVTVSRPTTIDGYTPRNNKLFCYPYTSLAVDCGNDTAEYRYEWFDKVCVTADNGYNFQLQGNTSPDPEIQCAPHGYNHVTSSSSGSTGFYNYSESIVMRGFPKVGWSIDVYKNWIANGGLANNVLGALGGAVSTSAGLAGVVATSGTSVKSISHTTQGALQIGSAIVENVVMSRKGGTGHGMQGSDIAVANRSKDFYFKKIQIQRDYAEAIDDYFTMYGYRVNKLKQPSRTGREKWNYVKTRDCIVLSNSVPADDVAKIEEIYDNGITWWMSGDYVGHYNLTNDIA